MRQLPFDNTRCVSATCPHRFKCLRFLDHPVGVFMPPYADLTPPYGETECEHFISAEDE